MAIEDYKNPLDQAKENIAVRTGLTAKPYAEKTGLKLYSDIVLNDFVLNKIDENNVVWVVSDIEGWWTPPEPDIQDITRGLWDGSYDVRGRWTARQITITGSFMPPSSAYVPVARDALIKSIGSLVYNSGWLRTYEDPPRASLVRLNGRPQIRTVNARGRTDFSIGLKAADPVKYEWSDADPDGYSINEIPAKNASEGSSGQGTINNIGNTPVTAVFQIEGPITGPATLQNITREELILIIGSIPAGSFLEIDTYDHTIALDGITTGNRSLCDTLMDWIKLDPGANQIELVDEGNANSTATMRVFYRSGWIG